jgi:hypothetical protein
VVIAAAVYRWNTANDMALVVGLVTNQAGTVVGAFFGVRWAHKGRSERRPCVMKT